MAQLLDTRPTDTRHTGLPRQPVASHLLVYGAFTCPWSYLASRRAARLASDGVTVDWRAVRHEPRPSLPAVREELERVLALLLPGEQLPSALAGFVPATKAAVSGYAEAYAAGVGSRVARLLFDAFWVHALDIGSPETVRTLLVDDIRSGSSGSELLREWGYAVDITGGPLTTPAWRLVRRWAGDWSAAQARRSPVLVVDGGAPRSGPDAVRWLGDELLRRGLDVEEAPFPPGPRVGPRTDVAPSSWVSQQGNRWLRDHQQAHRR